MLNLEFEIAVKGIDNAFVAYQAFEGYRVYKVRCVLRHNHVHVCVKFDECACKICNFVSRNSARNAEQNGFTFQHFIISLSSNSKLII